jgi:hypothetical protein
MFDRIRKALQRTVRGSGRKAQTDAGPSQLAAGPLSEWAATRGLSFSTALGHTLSMRGKIDDRPWRMELGPPARSYIHGEELRARGELGIAPDVGVLVINRSLRHDLDHGRFGSDARGPGSVAGARTPEELGWLATYDELTWEGPPQGFWRRYAVLAKTAEDAQSWLGTNLVHLMVEWPDPQPSMELPFLMALARGKCYLRMEHQFADMGALDHASRIFTAGCYNALTAFGGK